jgi:hypothetical protein
MKAIPATKRSRRPTTIPRREQHEFEPLDHSVYVGRWRLGRYERVAKRKYAAYDARGQLLGRFTKRTDALAAFDRFIVGGEQ